MKPPAPVTSTGGRTRPSSSSARSSGAPGRQSTQNAAACVCPLVRARAAFGGTVTVAVATVNGALEAGHEVTVATTTRSIFTPGSRPERRASRRKRGSSGSPTSRSGWPRRTPRYRAGLWRWLREHVKEFDACSS